MEDYIRWLYPDDAIVWMGMRWITNPLLVTQYQPQVELACEGRPAEEWDDCAEWLDD